MPPPQPIPCFPQGIVTWSNLSGVSDQAFYNAQIQGFDPLSNRTVVVDFLYKIQLLKKYCVGPAQGGNCLAGTACTSDFNCTTDVSDPDLCHGYCDYPSLPTFIDPTPPHGSVLIVYALQTNYYTIASNRTGSHCCEPGEYLFYVEGKRHPCCRCLPLLASAVRLSTSVSPQEAAAGRPRAAEPRHSCRVL